MKSVYHGFTLLELVMVIVILGVLAVGAYVKWPGKSLNLSGQAMLLAADLGYAQSLAMTTGQRYRLVKQSANTYQIQDASGAAVRTSSGQATTVTLGSGITFGTLSNMPSSLLNFDGRGIPYTDTTTPGTALAAMATWTLTAGGQSISITVTPGTGSINVNTS